MQKSSCKANDQSLDFPPAFKKSLKTFSFFHVLNKTHWKGELVVKFAASKDFTREPQKKKKRVIMLQRMKLV